MERDNKAQVKWACRRGMRELDLAMIPFFDNDYEALSDTDKCVFIRLLQCDDPDLFNWLINYSEPADSELKHMVRLIQRRNRQRGLVAV